MFITLIFIYSVAFTPSSGFLDPVQTPTDLENLDLRLALAMQKISGLENQVSTLQKDVNALNALKQTLLTDVANLKTEYNTIHNKDNDVAFFAEISQSIPHPVVGQTINFDDVITNSGSHYDPIHGVFRAPFNGTYRFDLVASAPNNPQTNNDYLRLYIMKNGVMVGYVYLDENTRHWVKSSASCVVHLNTNDRIWVQVYTADNITSLAGGGMHTYFLGYLIHTD